DRLDECVRVEVISLAVPPRTDVGRLARAPVDPRATFGFYRHPVRIVVDVNGRGRIRPPPRVLDPMGDVEVVVERVTLPDRWVEVDRVLLGRRGSIAKVPKILRDRFVELTN